MLLSGKIRHVCPDSSSELLSYSLHDTSQINSIRNIHLPFKKLGQFFRLLTATRYTKSVYGCQRHRSDSSDESQFATDVTVNMLHQITTVDYFAESLNHFRHSSLRDRLLV